MKYLLPALFYLAILQVAHACSCTGYVDEFCFSADTSDRIALVEILSFDDSLSSGVRVKLIENLNKEVPDTISILGKDGFNCNLNLSKFEVGDMLIVNMIFYRSAIQNFSNSLFYNFGIQDCTRHYLTFSDGIVSGNIDSTSSETEFEYEVFKDRLFRCFDFVLSTDDLENSSAIEVFPNPFSDQLTVQSNAPISDIKIFDLNGRQLQLDINKSSKGFEIDFSPQQDGVYIMQIITNQGILRRQIMSINQD